MTGPHHKSPTLDWDKIGRYLAGETSPEEAAEVGRWLEEHPSDAKVIAALQAATKNLAPSAPVDVEAALHRVKTRMRTTTTAQSRLRKLEMYAAAAVILLVAGVEIARLVSNKHAAVIASTTYETAVGERRDVVLSDGTRVTLGPASRLDVRDRVAQLTGEAYFSVVHDQRRPFTVHAGDAVIRDVGTVFSVHSDPTEPVRVAVSEGAVQLAHAQNSVTLTRGDVGVVEANGRVQASRGAATDDDWAWTRGRLVFRNTPVADLAPDLRRWYGVQLRVTDTALLRRHFTGSFAGEAPNRVLDVIALALGARVERRGDTAYIRTASPRK